MSNVVLMKTDIEPPFCEREILRYAGCKEAEEAATALMRACVEEAKPVLTYKVCYLELPLQRTGDMCGLGNFTMASKQLANNLKGCERALVFAATVGVGLDRLIAKYGHIAPSKALMMQAIGAERIEALCDAFCEDMERTYGAELRPRFSPGYGDLALEVQRSIFGLLECEKRIGLTLNDSMLMSPSKSVTAIVGLPGETVQNKEAQGEKASERNIQSTEGRIQNSEGRQCITDKTQYKNKCSACTKTDCAYRGGV